MARSVFTLEIVAAKHGDCLLLHWGDPAAPQLMLIDGGPAGVYKRFLSKRLAELEQSRGKPLGLNWVMISHIDDDHIRGILDLTAKLEQADNNGQQPSCEIDEIWFNAFDDIVGNSQIAAFARPESSATVLPHVRASNAVIASVNQGRKLRDRAARLGLKVNGGDKLIVGGWIWDMGEGLSFEILGPRQDQIDDFQRAWDKEVRKNAWERQPEQASVAAFLDKSPYNLASTVVLARHGNKTILLTGDARGDHILEGLREHGYLDRGHIEFDVLKVPHHGSDNNVSTDFFRQVRAQHYIISGDGHHGNPEISTLEMIRAARGDSQFEVHMTYRETRHHHHRELDRFLSQLAPAERKKFSFRQPDALSIKLDLCQRLTD